MYWLTMIKRLVLFFCLCLPALAVSAQEQEVKFAFDNYHRYYREARLCTDSAKLEAMKKLRVYFHEHPYRLSKVNMSVPPARCLELLTPEGTFSDMDALEAEFERSNAYRKGFHTTADDRVGSRRIPPRYADGRRVVERQSAESGGALRHAGSRTLERRFPFSRFLLCHSYGCGKHLFRLAG